jgi:hemin uptake protein HemP
MRTILILSQAGCFGYAPHSLRVIDRSFDNANHSYYSDRMPSHLNPGSSEFAAVNPPAGSGHAGPFAPTRTAGSGTPYYRSTDLLAGQKEILIDHAGQTYRLRCTALGKLILTK